MRLDWYAGNGRAGKVLKNYVDPVAESKQRNAS